MPSTFVVTRQDADQTIAAFLRKKLGLPWSKAQKVVESGHVMVAHQRTRDSAQRLKAGQHVQISDDSGIDVPKSAIVPTEPKKPKALKTKVELEPIPEGIQLVYLDESIVVVEKPAGLTTNRSAEDKAEFGDKGKAFLPKTLQDFLPRVAGVSARSIYAVHRLDRDTTGLVVFARNRESKSHLEKQFRDHSVDRKYIALVRGEPKHKKIETYLIDDRGDGRRGSSEVAGVGQRAITHLRKLESIGDCTLIECRLETGRTHQVRIHLGEEGTPLCGERIYDRPLNGKPFPDPSRAARPMLHAAHLGLEHPSTGEWMEWFCEYPDDLKAEITRVRSSALHGTPKDEPESDQENEADQDG
jgi:23S rRNA pseudouridine1911/1915/1917 synthase